jgi:hypothetical protein
VGDIGDGQSVAPLVVAHGHGVEDDMEDRVVNLLKRYVMRRSLRGDPLPPASHGDGVA